ncbi:hypothetical protein M409DRAFT_57007 [Zasmidium cellare ATCC 36951]|uniref:Uncharacterized protein n=1 Tax=Zasmidium cellare ATCC 36951 TaxID=1080233 RepID=A0A6A6CEN6_ZASCE|nr:uncharacterized protein M409DRAFT_57007 [Zasmidium cellare ATCC 36951]KAF2163896.1 hypothetical protein M409DRAFT_57007 [Zasmidium cellare ATCC 36951]
MDEWMDGWVVVWRGSGASAFSAGFWRFRRGTLVEPWIVRFLAKSSPWPVLGIGSTSQSAQQQQQQQHLHQHRAPLSTQAESTTIAARRRAVLAGDDGQSVAGVRGRREAAGRRLLILGLLPTRRLAHAKASSILDAPAAQTAP